MPKLNVHHSNGFDDPKKSCKFPLWPLWSGFTKDLNGQVKSDFLIYQ